jgi:hypothetical protein
MIKRPCGADTLVREMPEARMDKARPNKVLAAIGDSLFGSLTGLFAMAVAVLQEIFDESAYQRFLDRTHLKSSPDAYAVFSQESEQAKSRRPRCC